MIKLAHWTPAYRGMMRAELRNQSLLDFCTLAEQKVTYGSWHTASADLARARNEAVEHAIARGFDYLAMQDADVCAIMTDEQQESPLAQLLETAQAKSALLVGALCVLRRGHGEVNVDPLADGVYRADSIGTGLVLIDLRQLIARATTADYTGPWFANTYKDARHTRLERGEDMFFCELVKALGGEIWADARIATDHDGRLYKPGMRVVLPT